MDDAASPSHNLSCCNNDDNKGINIELNVVLVVVVVFMGSRRNSSTRMCLSGSTLVNE